METKLCIPYSEDNLKKVIWRFNHSNPTFDVRTYDGSNRECIRIYVRHPDLDIDSELMIDPYAFETIEAAEEYIKSKIQK